jgi:hypothetical protein
MTNRILFGLLLIFTNAAWSESHYPGLQVDVKRVGELYTFDASFDTPLTKCAAYHYLTDYEAAINLPGVVESFAYRQSVNKVTVERTADEQILFFHVRLHSVIEYTESPADELSFTQIKGDSKMFQGHWHIEPKQQGSTLLFHGLWEPDTLIPLYIIDHFAKNGLIDRFSAIAQLAEKHKDKTLSRCLN